MSTQEWRVKSPSEKQLKLAQTLGITNIPSTMGELSDLIKEKTGGSNTSQRQSGFKPYAAKPMNEITLPTTFTGSSAVEKKVSPVVLNLLATLKVVREECLKCGIDSSPAIGMLFNQTCEQLRSK